MEIVVYCRKRGAIGIYCIKKFSIKEGEDKQKVWDEKYSKIYELLHFIPDNKLMFHKSCYPCLED